MGVHDMDDIKAIARKKAAVEVDKFFELLELLRECGPQVKLSDNYSIDAMKEFAKEEYASGFIAGSKFSGEV